MAPRKHARDKYGNIIRRRRCSTTDAPLEHEVEHHWYIENGCACVEYKGLKLFLTKDETIEMLHADQDTLRKIVETQKKMEEGCLEFETRIGWTNFPDNIIYDISQGEETSSEQSDYPDAYERFPIDFIKYVFREEFPIDEEPTLPTMLTTRADNHSFELKRVIGHFELKRVGIDLPLPQNKKPKIATDQGPLQDSKTDTHVSSLSSKNPKHETKKPKHETNNTVPDSHCIENSSRMSAKNLRRRRNRAKNRAAKNCVTTQIYQ